LSKSENPRIERGKCGRLGSAFRATEQ